MLYCKSRIGWATLFAWGVVLLAPFPAALGEWTARVLQQEVMATTAKASLVRRPSGSHFMAAVVHI